MNFWNGLFSGRCHLVILAFILIMTSSHLTEAYYYSGRKGSYPRLGKRNDLRIETSVHPRTTSNDHRSDKILRRLYQIIGGLDRRKNHFNWQTTSKYSSE